MSSIGVVHFTFRRSVNTNGIVEDRFVRLDSKQTYLCARFYRPTRFTFGWSSRQVPSPSRVGHGHQIGLALSNGRVAYWKHTQTS